MEIELATCEYGSLQDFLNNPENQNFKFIVYERMCGDVRVMIVAIFQFHDDYSHASVINDYSADPLNTVIVQGHITPSFNLVAAYHLNDNSPVDGLCDAILKEIYRLKFL